MLVFLKCKKKVQREKLFAKMSSACMCVWEYALARACVCVFFSRFTPRELLSFLHRSLIEGRRDRGRWGREGGEDRVGGEEKREEEYVGSLSCSFLLREQ